MTSIPESIDLTADVASDVPDVPWARLQFNQSIAQTLVEKGDVTNMPVLKTVLLQQLKIVEDALAQRNGEQSSRQSANALSSQWEGGEIQLRVKRGKIVVVGEKDVDPGNKPTFKSSALSESTMVKGGHSATVGSSSKSFGLSVPWKVGDKSVAPLSPNGPPDLTLTICFRDSMFMLKHGNCEESSKLADRAPPPKSKDKTTLKHKATVQTDFIDLYNAQDSDEEPAVPLD